MTKTEKEYVESAMSCCRLNNPGGALLILNKLVAHSDYQSQVRKYNAAQSRKKNDMLKILKKAMRS